MKIEIDVQVLADISDFFHDLELAGLTLPPKINNVDLMGGPDMGAWHEITNAIQKYNLKETPEMKAVRLTNLGACTF